MPEPVEEQEIVVTAPRRPTCDIEGIKRRISHTHDPKVDGINSTRSQIAEFNDYFNSGGFSLSCKGEPNCRGHLFRVFGGDVKVDNEPGGIAVSIGGNIEHCTTEDEDESGAPGKLTCAHSRRLTRRAFISFSDILNANDQSAYMTCEPGRCEAYLLDYHRNINETYVHGAVLLIRKNKAGVETAQLIVNSADARVFADDELNSGRQLNKFKSCPTGQELQKEQQRRGRQENSSGAK